MAVRCELCGNLSPERSIRCDCGYDFRIGEVTASIEGGERELEVARREIAALGDTPVGLVIRRLVFGVPLIASLLSPFSEFAALIALASWLLVVACAVGIVIVKFLGITIPSRQLRQAKARQELPTARVVAVSPFEGTGRAEQAARTSWPGDSPLDTGRSPRPGEATPRGLGSHQ